MLLRKSLILAAALALVPPDPARAAQYRLEVDTFTTAEYELRCSFTGGRSAGKTIELRHLGHHNFTFEADAFKCSLTGLAPHNLILRVFQDGYQVAPKRLIFPFRVFDFSDRIE